MEQAREGKFLYDSVQDAKTLAKYLRAIQEGFEAGRICLSRKDLALTLSPAGLIGFAVEAKAKEGRMKLTLKFSWRESEDDEGPAPDDLDITA
jgi:amphi-Trp domain-containing protein